MRSAVDSVKVFMVFLGTYALVWLPMLLFFGNDWIGNITALIVAVAVARHLWRSGTGSVAPAGYIVYGALLFGGVGFAAGFYGPMLLAPAANQGPLLGIIITGPAGLLAGAAAGFIYGRTRTRRGKR
jgi:hypothetical protein